MSGLPKRHKETLDLLVRLQERQKREMAEVDVDEKAVSKPSHYTFGKYEPRKVISDWNLNFNKGNAVKYLARAGRKDGNSELQDLKKAKQYIEFEIEELEKNVKN